MPSATLIPSGSLPASKLRTTPAFNVVWLYFIEPASKLVCEFAPYELFRL
jgi:hypothetical protein